MYSLFPTFQKYFNESGDAKFPGAFVPSTVRVCVVCFMQPDGSTGYLSAIFVYDVMSGGRIYELLPHSLFCVRVVRS